jgi:hypothetical protein
VRLRLIALWSNLLYLVAVAVALGVTVGMGAASLGTPWRGYANVAVVAVVAAATGLLNVRCLRRRRWTAASAVAVALNLVSLAYLFLRPRYEHVLIEAAVLSIPLLNIAFLLADLRPLRHSQQPEDSRKFGGS